MTATGEIGTWLARAPELLARGPDLARQAGPPLAHHLWEATLFAAAVAALLVPLRRAPAGTRYRLYLLASIKFLIPTVALAALFRPLGAGLGVGFGSALPSGALAVFRADGRAADLAASFGRWLCAQLAAGWTALGGDARAGFGPAALPLLAGAVWAAGTLFLTVRFLRRRARVAAEVAAAPACEEPAIRAALAAARERIGLDREVGLRESPAVESPAVWGIRRPVLLLPLGLAARLTAAELEAVLLHELEHVRRRDNLAALVQGALGCLFWFHPLVWWLRRRLLAERERACDDRVVELGAEPRLYARSLLKVLHLGAGQAATAFGVTSAATASDLRRRIEAITAPRRPARLTPVRRGALTAAVASLVVLSLAAASPETTCDLARACELRVVSHPRWHPPADSTAPTPPTAAASAVPTPSRADRPCRRSAPRPG